MRKFFFRFHWLVLPVMLLLLTQGIFAVMLYSLMDTQILLTTSADLKSVAVGRLDPLGPDSNYFHFLSSWDGQWYKSIVQDGYPTELPRDASGQVQINPSAFFPLYPALVYLIMTLTGLSFEVGGLIISLSFALGGFMLLYHWIYSHTGKIWPAILALLSIMLMPAALVFQLTYTEGLAFFLLTLFLYLFSRGHFLRAIPVVLLLAFTRSIVIPLLVIGAIMGLIWTISYCKKHKLTLLQAFRLERKAVTNYLILGGVTAISALLWPATVGIITGDPMGYFESFSGWFLRTPSMFAWFTIPRSSYIYGSPPFILTVPFAVLIILLALFLAFQKRSAYPLILRIFPLTLACFIFSLTPPSGSTTRYLIVGFFLVPFTRIPRTVNGRILYFGSISLFFVIALLGGYLWIAHNWIVDAGTLGLLP